MATIFQTTFSNAFPDIKMYEICSARSKQQYCSCASDNGQALNLGDKPLPEPILVQFTNAYMQH